MQCANLNLELVPNLMDETSTLGFVAFGLQFVLLLSAIALLNCRVQRIELAKCNCCSVGHPLLDPINV